MLTLTATPKPIINLAQLELVKGIYLNLRRLGFTRAAIESHLCSLLLLNEELVEEVEAVLTATAENDAITPDLVALR